MYILVYDCKFKSMYSVFFINNFSKITMYLQFTYGRPEVPILKFKTSTHVK